MMQDVRWMQRFSNYLQALESLKRAVALSGTRPLTELEMQGLIQGFEFTHELSWNLLKDYLTEQGVMELIGSRNATRAAFKNGMLTDGEVWMEMIRARNLTTHTYNLDVARAIASDILTRFFPAFLELEATFLKLRDREAPGS
ncbi:MAG: nucleotidyltransferase [Gemmatimonadales bacterium]|nr:nucleotidyltransferase substrate binding protein [Myxococcota bacterium]MBU1511396.1 nucleotidyltransferase substrate binding protein [Myxococcota bacterium]TFH60358.1 MAG: nucleotidyltransferase [Gemmatimonadales bacterium]